MRWFLGLCLAVCCSLSYAQSAPIPFPTNNMGDSFNCQAAPDVGVVEYFGDCHYHWSAEQVWPSGCYLHEGDRYWVPSVLHPGYWDFMIEWSLDPGCGTPSEGTLNMGYDLHGFHCEANASLDDTANVALCHCPTVLWAPTNQVIPQTFETGSCEPDLIYVNPFIVLPYPPVKP